MYYIYHYLIYGLWILWVAYWQISALNVKSNVKKESIASRASHFVLLFLGVFLLVQPVKKGSWFAAECWPQSIYSFWLGVLVLIGGFIVAVWARRVLGRNWSNAVTVKKDHELIQQGPYARIRHPIYTGLLMGILGSAIALSEWRGLVGFALVFISFTIKMRLEERWMTEVFGPAYDAYRARTGLLLPKLG